MRKGAKKYRIIQNELDKKGILVAIVRVHNKCFNLVVNGEIRKTYRQRHSCNKQLQILNQNS